MRKFLLLIPVLALLALIPFAAKSDTPDAVDQDVLVTVDGLVCDFCAQSLKKVFGKEEGVAGLSVDLDNQLVIVDTKDGMDISDEKIKELIEWGGYDLVEIKRETAE